MLAELDGLTATGDNATMALTITVDDAATALEGKTITEATNVGTVDFSAAGINDAFAAVTNGTAVHANMAAVDAKDADVNITVNDTVANVSEANVTAINALQAATTGTITATIDGNAAELDDLTATGDNATMALTITVDDTATAAAGAAIADATSIANTGVNFALGITDSFASVTTGAAIHSNIGKIDAKDANVNITVNDTAANVSADNVSAINALQAATTGTITATIDGNASRT